MTQNCRFRVFEKKSGIPDLDPFVPKNAENRTQLGFSQKRL